MTAVILVIVILVITGLALHAREARQQLRQERREKAAVVAAFTATLRDLGYDPQQVPQLTAPPSTGARTAAITMIAVRQMIRGLGLR